jgi:hypothetical protein
MSPAQRLAFELQPSLIKKVLLGALLLLLWGMLRANLGDVWAILICVLALTLHYVLSAKTSIVHVAHLYDELWLVGDVQQHQEMQLLGLQPFGLAVFMHFTALESKKLWHLCIFRDQLSKTQWCRLQRLARHHSSG